MRERHAGSPNFHVRRSLEQRLCNVLFMIRQSDRKHSYDHRSEGVSKSYVCLPQRDVAMPPSLVIGDHHHRGSWKLESFVLGISSSFQVRISSRRVSIEEESAVF